MTREEARKAAEVMLAYANGEEIEAMDFGGKYNSAENPSFSWDKIKYRIKPTYRPFKNKEECWQEMLKHRPFGWLKYKDSRIFEDCRCVYDYGIFGSSFNDSYKDYTFADGTPFGIREE